MDIRPEDMLRAVPVKNRAMTVEPREGGSLVSVPLARPRWAMPPLTWIFPVSRERRVQLDAVGSRVLSLCDGRRTVEDVIEAVMAEHRLSFQEARVSVLQFFRMLMERGVVAVAVSERGRKGEKGS